jgi:hypothetical protein
MRKIDQKQDSQKLQSERNTPLWLADAHRSPYLYYDESTDLNKLRLFLAEIDIFIKSFSPQPARLSRLFATWKTSLFISRENSKRDQKGGETHHAFTSRISQSSPIFVSYPRAVPSNPHPSSKPPSPPH